MAELNMLMVRSFILRALRDYIERMPDDSIAQRNTYRDVLDAFNRDELFVHAKRPENYIGGTASPFAFPDRFEKR